MRRSRCHFKGNECCQVQAVLEEVREGRLKHCHDWEGIGTLTSAEIPAPILRRGTKQLFRSECHMYGSNVKEEL